MKPQDLLRCFHFPVCRSYWIYSPSLNTSIVRDAFPFVIYGTEVIHLLLKTQRFSYSWIPAQNVAALTTTWKRECHFISFLLSIWVFCFLHLKFWTAVPGCSAQTRVSSVIIWITCISLALHRTHSHKGLGSSKNVSADCPPTLQLWSYRQTVLVFAVCF